MGNFLEIAGETIQNEMLLNEYRTAGMNWGDAMNTGITERLAEGSSLIRAAAESAITSAFSNPFQVMAQINLTGNYQLRNKVSSQDGYASGGYVSGGPQLSWLAEEGYGEFIIPTNPSRRSDAIALYQQAGAALGVSAYAAGGYVGAELEDNYHANIPCLLYTSDAADD